MSRSSFYNSEGYPDPTAYMATRHLDHPLLDLTERPVVYICSPYSGDIAGNIRLARSFSAVAVSRGTVPLAPHLVFPQFMDDEDPLDRELAMLMNKILLDRCDEIWVYQPTVSVGMKQEIQWARGRGMVVRFFDIDFTEVTR
ncbi:MULTISPECIES: DUF4406 domain-containing protein [unclassified Corynebacterium]|uniref:DUF7768 domain-containing protein n=1 Tax=unclassified Corynebacterium TaxID=2624378 RepID=UPI00211C2275|nr:MULTISPECIES: DUF4406 domain-containing protein [unclassified Corynebacterium]MCQ9359256.1 DUF4406 domain-containing protein [Corynebacterium sp. 142RC1]MCQ9365397.1 DUF4406 domain-containing protein [Corynebacterium sp. 70RC1]